MSYSEFQLIRRFFVDQGLGFERQGVVLGIGDDAAIVQPPAGMALALSLDTLVAGIHFSEDAAPEQIANRALAVNLSDLAAMAAEPLCFTLGLTLPTSDDRWLQRFSAGLLPLAREFNCSLVGGDTTRGPLAITVQVHGFGAADSLLRRSTAQPGDCLCVTGTLGDAAAALLALDTQSHLGKGFRFEHEPTPAERDYFVARYFAPTPRVNFSRSNAAMINACIDISDGLIGDLGHLLEASGAGAELDVALLPYSAAVKRTLSREHAEQAALAGGDDYELCFTVPVSQLASVQAQGAALGVNVTQIGQVSDKPGLRLTRDGRRIDSAGESYQHF